MRTLPKNFRKAAQFHIFTLRQKDFSHTLYSNIFYIYIKPVLPVVDKATNFQSANWMKDMKSDTLWRALRMCWIDVYLEPPDGIVHEVDKAFMASTFKENTFMLPTCTKSIPVESSNSMAVVEHYHAPLC